MRVMALGYKPKRVKILLLLDKLGILHRSNHLTNLIFAPIDRGALRYRLRRGC